ncbi:MAG: WYL domain-containing protein [Actinomycetota bacterium]|jgi:proteasome accessory factor C|nr:WYL domain-containing protein [Euzebyaceae bacterium]MDQ3452415.1 WYL domain-containing protein [Actinomycetota bacterium]
MSRPTPTLARLERILTMVPWLLDNPGVSVDEVGERFGASREELADDLDVLGYCGLPGYGGGDLVEAWLVGDRVTVRMADFFSRPLRLSLREALTLLLAARALGSVEGLAESGALRRAVSKLQVLLGGDEAKLAVDLSAPGDELLGVLRHAVDDGEVLRLVYRSASKAQTTQRDVEPWAVVGWGGSWYLQGWCRLATAPRDFRLDRIRSLEPTGERVTGQRAGGVPPVYQPSVDDIEVVLDLAPRAAWVAEWLVVDAVEGHDGVHRVRLRTANLDWVARLVVQLGGAAMVVQPAALTIRVIQLASATLRRYSL